MVSYRVTVDELAASGAEMDVLIDGTTLSVAVAVE